MLAVLFKQAFDITGDPLTIGIIGLLQFVPAVLLVVVSGYLADRFDRRRITALMTVGRIVCALAFATYSRDVGDVSNGTDAAVWPLFLITLAFGSFDAIAIPARHALTPLVVIRRRLPNLVAAGAVTMVLSSIVGPIAGGLSANGPGERQREEKMPPFRETVRALIDHMDDHDSEHTER